MRRSLARPLLQLCTVSLRRDRPSSSMASLSSKENYRAAISALNGLQTNAATLELIRRHGDDRRVSEQNRMQQYLERVGISPSDLQQLKAIHVSGTKGKGSVCAMTESILRRHGLKTGLYVSPHLLEVRERIMINGQPLSRETFVFHFWDVYDKLNNTRHLYSDAMPSYFRFLTVMAFSVFLSSKVDVAVLEVGIGGTHDSTNIIQEPVVCGITSLGYDHTDILGSTLSEIAWHKGGICKEHRPAFTVDQAPEALTALTQRAAELGAHSLSVVPPLSSYPGPVPVLGLRGKHQTSNASLAAQLCLSWLDHSKGVTGGAGANAEICTASPFPLTEEFRDGLRLCHWAGRNQVVKGGNITYYLDGAHTPGSMESCVEWYQSELPTNHVHPPLQVLLFNTTGNRDPQTYLQPLLECGFSKFVFCPNLSHSTVSPNSPDHTNRMVTNSKQVARCYANQQCLQHLTGWDESATEDKTKVCPAVSDAVEYISSLSSGPVAVLATGSLHLVGTVMGVLGFTVDDL